MTKDLLSTFNMSECLYTFALYDTPTNVTRSTAMIYSPKYRPKDSITEPNPEPSRWDMKFTNIYLFAADI